MNERDYNKGKRLLRFFTNLLDARMKAGLLGP